MLVAVTSVLAEWNSIMRCQRCCRSWSTLSHCDSAPPLNTISECKQVCMLHLAASSWGVETTGSYYEVESFRYSLHRGYGLGLVFTECGWQRFPTPWVESYAVTDVYVQQTSCFHRESDASASDMFRTFHY
jgi:hypothetical protein